MRELNQVFINRTNNNNSSEESEKLSVYYGSSMSSIFQDMDVLYYMHNKRIRPGDVIVFKIPGHEHKITHRVISVGKKGIRTMGDCNPRPDNWLLRPNQILGYVAYGYRGKRIFSVLNGPAGIVNMFRIRFKRLIIKTAYPILSAIYNSLPVSNLVINIIQPRTVAFKRSNGTELHLLARGRIIGRRPPGQKWQIKSPFRFFLDEGSLPD
ncbi:MAG: hypothetical protein ACM3MI_05115 [Clostridiales bacterium]